VLHAAQQDLEVLQRSCGTVPARLLDTQLAAGFLGHATPSLVNLLAAELKVKLPKGDRLTDWLRRPLTADQRSYAASDVAHLLELADKLRAQLERRGRLAWAEDECEALRTRPVGPNDPESAWLRIKDHRHLKGASRGVAQAVAAWRERRAAEQDLPTRFVLADLAILGIAQRPPKTLEDLKAVRGLDERNVRGQIGKDLMEAIELGVSLPVTEIRTVEREDVERTLRPAVTLVSAWVSQLARDHDLDTSLLATRSDIVGLLNEDAESRLSSGWRRELVGNDVDRLVHGSAALAFDGRGGLKLVDINP
jgi:ribonuclease D